MRLLFVIFFLFVSFQSLSVFAEKTTGATSFLKQQIGSRSASMGHAFTAVADDASAFYHNPAGIASLNWSYLSIHGQKIPSDRYMGTLSFVDGPSKESTLSFGFALQTLYDNTSQTAANSTDMSNVVYFTIAKAFGESEAFKLGANIKGIYETLGSETAYGGGLDLGTLVSVSFINMGVMIQDFFTVESTDSGLVYADKILKLGLATNLSNSNAFKISLQIDKNLSSTNKAIFRIGGYVKLWQGSGDIDYGLDGTKGFEDNFSKILSDSTSGKSFTDELYLNFGYGDSEIGLGLTLKYWGLKFDLSASFPKLFWRDTTLLFTMDIPLY